MNRRDRRNNDPSVQQRRQKLAGGDLIGVPGLGEQKPSGRADGGGWGVGNNKQEPATGQQPAVNPFMLPKAAGINMISNVFPSNYYVEWNLATWRAACDQAIKMGQCMSYGTLSSWSFECSSFIQSLFTKLGAAIDRVNFSYVDKKGNKLDIWTEELCMKPWQMQLRREILFSFFWGFSGVNFDPLTGKIYKYPMQNIDPINRMLKSSTYAYYDGVSFEDAANLLFIQPSTSYESFLGWMQPITRAFIQMNLSKNNWLSAGRRLAFPLMSVGYPQNDSARDPVTGIDLNPFKFQAEEIAANIDPSKGVVYPYTIGGDGKIQKSIEVEFENPGAGNNMFKIYSEFNDEEKDEIRELVFGGSLTSTTQSNGNRALGEVQERMLDAVIDSKMKFVLSVMNTDYAPKIAKFYKNLPQGSFTAERAKILTMEEMQLLSEVVTQNGKRLTDDFFEANGVAREFIEENPNPIPPPIGGKGGKQNDDDEADVNAARKFQNTFQSKKKFS